MLDFQQKRKIRSFVYSRPFLWFLFVVAVFFLHSAWSAYNKKIDSDKMRQTLSDDVVELTQRKSELSIKIERLGTKEGIEEEVRSRFSVAKPGEDVLVIIESKNKDNDFENIDRSWLIKIKEIIQGFF